jgi:hypothetical protein
LRAFSLRHLRPARYISTPITSATTTPMRMAVAIRAPSAPPSVILARIVMESEADQEQDHAKGDGESAKDRSAMRSDAVGGEGEAESDDYRSGEV